MTAMTAMTVTAGVRGIRLRSLKTDKDLSHLKMDTLPIQNGKEIFLQMCNNKTAYRIIQSEYSRYFK